MRYHLLGLHHTQCNDDYSACAFTGKVRRLPDVLHAMGTDAHVTLYGVGSGMANDTDADNFVSCREHPIATGDTYNQHTQDKDSIANFEACLMNALRDRVEPGDFILHPLGTTHSGLVQAFPEQIHVESGIGYMSGPFGAYRIFESEAWRHWHFGRYHDYPMRYAYSGGPQAYENTFVAPNYYDPADWPLGDGAGDYVLFAGRLEGYKGLEIVAEVARRMPETKFKIAGQGPHGELFFGDLPNCELLGVVKGKARAALYGGARCMIMPTAYVEPFGGSAVEALLCGTPVVASSFGAFTETIEQCDRCRTPAEFVAACTGRSLIREHRRRAAINRWSIDAVAHDYRRAFEALAGRP